MGKRRKGGGRERIASTFNEQMRRIYKQYIDAGGKLPVSLDEIYLYAQKNKLWEPQPTDLRKQFRKQMSQALREDYFEDEKGRTVRRHHAMMVPAMEDGKKVQRALWDDIDTAPRTHMEAAFQLRRGQIVGDCKQLKNDADHYNDAHEDQKPIVTLLDFTDDVEEGDLPTEYKPDTDDPEPDVVV